jgi:hypothetical protein
VLLVIGGIHAGEIDGKDAGLALLRDLAAGPPSLGLSAATVVFVPCSTSTGTNASVPTSGPTSAAPDRPGSAPRPRT